MGKSLKDKAVDIKGKKYVLVADRIVYFNDEYKDGQITTELLTAPESPLIVIRAIVEPTPGRKFIGHSQATVGDGYINKTSALENAETSAVGRALAMMGIGVIDSIASVDEIHKAQTATPSDAPFQSTNPARKTKLEPAKPTDYVTLINSAKSEQELEAIGTKIKEDLTISSNKKSALRSIYEGRIKALQHASESVPTPPTA